METHFQAFYLLEMISEILPPSNRAYNILRQTILRPFSGIPSTTGIQPGSLRRVALSPNTQFRQPVFNASEPEPPIELPILMRTVVRKKLGQLRTPPLAARREKPSKTTEIHHKTNSSARRCTHFAGFWRGNLYSALYRLYKKQCLPMPSVHSIGGNSPRVGGTLSVSHWP